MSEVTVAGETFQLRRIAATRVLRFASLAAAGADETDPRALAAIEAILEKAVRPEDRERFDDACDDAELSFEDLMAIVVKIIEDVAGNPTSERSDSSSGPLSTSGPSVGGSSSPVIARLEAQGRPDLALIVDQAQRSRVSA